MFLTFFLPRAWRSDASGETSDTTVNTVTGPVTPYKKTLVREGAGVRFGPGRGGAAGKLAGLFKLPAGPDYRASEHSGLIHQPTFGLSK